MNTIQFWNILMFFTNYISIFFVRQLTRWWNSIIFFLISNLPYHRPLLLLFLHHLQDQIGKCGTFHILLLHQFSFKLQPPTRYKSRLNFNQITNSKFKWDLWQPRYLSIWCKFYRFVLHNANCKIAFNDAKLESIF